MGPDLTWPLPSVPAAPLAIILGAIARSHAPTKLVIRSRLVPVALRAAAAVAAAAAVGAARAGRRAPAAGAAAARAAAAAAAAGRRLLALWPLGLGGAAAGYEEDVTSSMRGWVGCKREGRC